MILSYSSSVLLSDTFHYIEPLSLLLYYKYIFYKDYSHKIYQLFWYNRFRLRVMRVIIEVYTPVIRVYM